jgi:hypothetical protein
MEQQCTRTGGALIEREDTAHGGHAEIDFMVRLRSGTLGGDDAIGIV